MSLYYSSPFPPQSRATITLFIMHMNSIIPRYTFESLDLGSVKLSILSALPHYHIGFHDVGIHAVLCVSWPFVTKAQLVTTSVTLPFLTMKSTSSVSIEKPDVGEGKDVAEDGGGEESGMVDNDLGIFVIIEDLEVIKQEVCEFVR